MGRPASNRTAVLVRGDWGTNNRKTEGQPCEDTERAWFSAN